ncbi:hypothetical protein [Mucilaginibacter gilvus]|uniref:Uncharacterized protein n=1 Tax=Mucilaginibacter gilvus TaxID=2305909 RepID=A0A444MQ30_9SPHI|nr:hypothetical protein [Mucilaginibacter gilvus]RWY53746.1 hypothetical protein EPL05_06660 [Mucilaginibacter gilvus]
MPPKSNYDEQAKLLAQATDIAISSFEYYPPDDWNENTISYITKTYSDWREDALNPKPQFKNIVSFKYLSNEIFTYFQEGSGTPVDNFWSELN